MRNGQYPNTVRFDDEQEVVGKALEPLPPHVTSNTLVGLGIAQNLVDSDLPPVLVPLFKLERSSFVGCL
jgi:hypothetical protein